MYSEPVKPRAYFPQTRDYVLVLFLPPNTICAPFFLPSASPLEWSWNTTGTWLLERTHSLTDWRLLSITILILAQMLMTTTASDGCAPRKCSSAQESEELSGGIGMPKEELTEIDSLQISSSGTQDIPLTDWLTLCSPTTPQMPISGWL